MSEEMKRQTLESKNQFENLIFEVDICEFFFRPITTIYIFMTILLHTDRKNRITLHEYL